MAYAHDAAVSVSAWPCGRAILTEAQSVPHGGCRTKTLKIHAFFPLSTQCCIGNAGLHRCQQLCLGITERWVGTELHSFIPDPASH